MFKWNVLLIGLVVFGVCFTVRADYDSAPKMLIGYKYTFDLNDNSEDKLALYAKIKKPKGQMKFGIDMKYRDVSKSAALFISQEFKLP
jgi:hypothetical protein